MRKQPYPITQLAGGINSSVDPLFLKDSESPDAQTARLNKKVLTKNFGFGTFGTVKDNLCVNGSMELDSNWSDYGTPAVNERSAAQVHGGAYSRKFVADDSWDGIKSDTFTTVTGATYSCSFWIYPDDATSIAIAIRKGDDSGDMHNTIHDGLTQDAWNHIQLDITETAGGNGAYIIFNTDLGSGTWYVDDVEIHDTARIMDLSTYSRLSGVNTLIALTLRQANAYNTSTEEFDCIDGSQVFTGDEDDIFFTEHFADKYIITNGRDAIYRYDGTTFEVLGGLAAPDPIITAKYLASFYNHLILFNTVEDGADCPLRVRWSDTGDGEEWDDTDSGTTAGYFDLTETSGEITGCRVLRDRLFVFKTDSVWEIFHVGGSDVFRARMVINGIGTGAGKAIEVIGEKIVFMGSNNFYEFDGSTLTPIGDNISGTYFEPGSMDTNTGKLNRAVSTKLPTLDTWFVGIPTNSDDPDILLEYDFTNKAWMKRNMDLTSICFVSLTTRTVWDDFSGVWDDATGTWDNYGASTGSSFLLTGQNTGLVEKSTTAELSSELFFYETKELVFAHLVRLTEIRLVAKGTTIDVSWSTNGGLTWSETETVNLQSDEFTENIVWLDITCRNIRFKFATYATEIAIKYIEPWYIPRKRSDGGL